MGDNMTHKYYRKCDICAEWHEDVIYHRGKEVCIYCVEKLEDFIDKNIEDIINMFFAQKHLYERINGTYKLNAAESKLRCGRCVYELSCTRDRNVSDCPDYKRDPPDGGYYG